MNNGWLIDWLIIRCIFGWPLGAAVTTYKRWERTVTTYDEDGKPNGHRKESG